MLRTDVFFPFAAPSTGAFIEISPLGARQGCRASAEGQEPLLLTLDKSEERRKQAATGSPFLWLLSFKKVTRLRVRQADSIKCRVSDSLMLKR
jgi:hypothetical protein